MNPLSADTRKWLILAALAAALVVVFFVLNQLVPDAASVLRRGRKDLDRGRYVAARSAFEQAMAMSRKSSGVRCEARLFYSISFVREGRFREGERELEAFIAEYPNSFWTPQAYFDLAYCRRSLGEKAAAYRIYVQIIDLFSNTSWAEYARDKLKEFGGRAPGDVR